MGRFGVTYEGLKHHNRGSYEEKIGPRFGVTYEGLKHIVADRYRAEVVRFWSYL